MKKSIFITGGAAGIGRDVATLFANNGWFVGISDVNKTGLDVLTKRLAGKIGFSAHLDVTDEKKVASVLSEFSHAAGGQINVLFNNAGILRTNNFEDISLKDHHSIIDINNKGILNCTYHAFPYLKKAKGARVINMSSVASYMPAPTHGTYSATKFWVRGFTETLNVEWKQHGIHVCDIMPNYVDTPMLENNPGKIVANLGVFITSDEVAKTVWKAAEKKRLHWIIDKPLNKMMLKLRGGLVPFELVRFFMRKKAGI